MIVPKVACLYFRIFWTPHTLLTPLSDPPLRPPPLTSQDLQDEIASLQNDVNRSQFRVQVHSLGRVRAAAVHSMMIAEMRANFDQEVQGYEKVGMLACV